MFWFFVNFLLDGRKIIQNFIMRDTIICQQRKAHASNDWCKNRHFICVCHQQEVLLNQTSYQNKIMNKVLMIYRGGSKSYIFFLCECIRAFEICWKIFRPYILYYIYRIECTTKSYKIYARLQERRLCSLQLNMMNVCATRSFVYIYSEQPCIYWNYQFVQHYFIWATCAHIVYYMGMPPPTITL